MNVRWAKEIWNDDARRVAMWAFALVAYTSWGYARFWNPFTWSISDGSLLLGLLPPIVLLGGVGVYRHWNWGRWLLIAAAIVALLGVLLKDHGDGWFSVLRLLRIAGCLWAIYELWNLSLLSPSSKELLQRMTGSPEGVSGDAESNRELIAFLTDRPIRLTNEILAAAAQRAYGKPFYQLQNTSEDENHDDDYVGGKTPHFACCHQGIAVAIDTYHDSPVSPADFLNMVDNEPTLVRPIRSHTSIINFGLLATTRSITQLEVYQICGRLAAELLDSSCLAIWYPDFARLEAPHESTKPQLRRGGPFLWSLHPPTESLINVSDTNPNLRAATAEARAQWPVFVERFRQAVLGDGAQFLVKVPFHDDQGSEAMWIQVRSIDGDLIQGVLDNDPEIVSSVRLGDAVQRSVAEISDWMITDAGEVRGGFTLEALRDELRRSEDSMTGPDGTP